MQVVILAGGLGTRLRPLTWKVSKPMVPVAGKPFLEHQIEFLAVQGLSRFLLLTGHLGDQIQDHFGDGSRLGVRIDYSHETRPLGTGGGLRQALGRLEGRFLLLYGDSFLPEDYAAIGERFRNSDAGGLMVVFRDREGETGLRPNVAVGPASRVRRYEKGGRGEDLRYVEAGVVGLQAEEVEGLPPGRPASLESELYPALASRGRLEAWVTRARFYDIGTPGGLDRAEQYFRDRASRARIRGKDGKP